MDPGRARAKMERVSRRIVPGTEWSADYWNAEAGHPFRWSFTGYPATEDEAA